jgi:hypothetical protein
MSIPDYLTRFFGLYLACVPESVDVCAGSDIRFCRMGLFGEDCDAGENEALFGLIGAILIAEMQQGEHCLALEAGVYHLQSKIVFNKQTLKFIIQHQKGIHRKLLIIIFLRTYSSPDIA